MQYFISVKRHDLAAQDAFDALLKQTKQAGVWDVELAW